LKEADVGITVLINDKIPRFECVLKHKLSDFQVFEVDEQGQVVRLKNVPSQADLTQEMQQKQEESKMKKEIIETQSFDFDTADAKALAEILGEVTFAKLKTFPQEAAERSFLTGENQPAIVTPVLEDKALRTAIHKGVRAVFVGALDSKATDDSRVKITAAPKRSKGSGRGRPGASAGTIRSTWPESGDYCQFHVYKEGKDTMEVANMLSRVLQKPPKTFGYAGTKDRRGCTVQRFTAYRVATARLANLNRTLKDIVLGDFSYTKNGLTLGDLSGNRFLLTLRSVTGASKDEIETALTRLREVGFINYYGMQRFGTSSTGTHEVGAHVLKHEFEKAVRLILSEHAGAQGETRAAKLHWIATSNAVETLERMPSRCIAEVAMLRQMVKAKSLTDWNASFHAVPRNLRLMYMHAYQSYVWNFAASQRIQQFGMQPVAGDLVLTEQSAEGEKTGASGREVIRAKLLTEDDLANYTIYDVVLPCPGCDVLYPGHSIKEVYVEVMKQHGLDPFNMVTTVKESTLMGAYRKLLSKPITLSWEVLQYEDEDQQIAATNLDELEGRTITLPTDGSKTAVKLEFQLETAAYATMLLREVV
ncbi:pseudouridine synthase, partial [Protomyces lactucae-debilis]